MHPMHRPLLFLAVFASSIIAAGPSPTEWMPRVDDQTGLWWVNGPPKGFQSEAQPKEEILCFQLGGKEVLFDTRRVRPVEGEWECAVIAEGRRFACTGHLQPKDEFLQPVRFVESGRFFSGWSSKG